MGCWKGGGLDGRMLDEQSVRRVVAASRSFLMEH